MTTIEGLGYSGIPCAHVLSVAGFSVILLLFPLGRRVYSERNSLPDYLGFLTVSHIPDSYSRSVRRWWIPDIYHIKRDPGL